MPTRLTSRITNRLNLSKKLKSITLLRETFMQKETVKLQPFFYLNSACKLAAFGSFMVITTFGAGIAYAAVTSFGGRVPAFGSDTLPTRYITTAQYRNISVRMTQNPHDFDITAVTCGGSNISSSKRIPARSTNVYTLAANVRNGTCFQLKVGSRWILPFNISGVMTY
jgi:hypothetical protein